MSDDSFDQTFGERLSKGIFKNPVPVFGSLTFFAIGALGAYRYKKRGTTTSPSLFLLQLRVVAQGTVVLLLMGGMGYHMYNDYIKRSNKNKLEDHKN